MLYSVSSSNFDHRWFGFAQTIPYLNMNLNPWMRSDCPKDFEEINFEANNTVSSKEGRDLFGQRRLSQDLFLIRAYAKEFGSVFTPNLLFFRVGDIKAIHCFHRV
jgi:hypothetical protein